MATKRMWTKEETEQLLKVKRDHPEAGWNIIASLMKGRNARQCKDRWTCSIADKSDWTREEDELILRERRKNSGWAAIAPLLTFGHSRQPLQVRNRWRQLNNDIPEGQDGQIVPQCSSANEREILGKSSPLHSTAYEVADFFVEASHLSTIESVRQVPTKPSSDKAEQHHDLNQFIELVERLVISENEPHQDNLQGHSTAEDIGYKIKQAFNKLAPIDELSGSDEYQVAISNLLELVGKTRKILTVLDPDNMVLQREAFNWAVSKLSINIQKEFHQSRQPNLSSLMYFLSRRFVAKYSKVKLITCFHCFKRGHDQFKCKNGEATAEELLANL